MRKITYNHAIAEKKENGDYPVRLGNGAVNIFRTKKETLAFFVKTSQFLENQIISINAICANIYGIFTDFWFYTDADRQAGISYIETERKIRHAFDLFHEFRADVFSMPYRKTALIITFSYTEKMIDELVSIVENIIYLIKEKSLSAHVFTLKNYKLELERIQTTVLKFGHDTAVKTDTRLLTALTFDLFSFSQKNA